MNKFNNDLDNGLDKNLIKEHLETGLFQDWLDDKHFWIHFPDAHEDEQWFYSKDRIQSGLWMKSKDKMIYIKEEELDEYLYSKTKDNKILQV